MLFGSRRSTNRSRIVQYYHSIKPSYPLCFAYSKPAFALFPRNHDLWPWTQRYLAREKMLFTFARAEHARCCCSSLSPRGNLIFGQPLCVSIPLGGLRGHGENRPVADIQLQFPIWPQFDIEIPHSSGGARNEKPPTTKQSPKGRPERVEGENGPRATREITKVHSLRVRCKFEERTFFLLLVDFLISFDVDVVPRRRFSEKWSFRVWFSTFSRVTEITEVYEVGNFFIGIFLFRTFVDFHWLKKIKEFQQSKWRILAEFYEMRDFSVFFFFKQLSER